MLVDSIEPCDTQRELKQRKHLRCKTLSFLTAKTGVISLFLLDDIRINLKLPRMNTHTDTNMYVYTHV